jgi:hypothetical protein
MPVYWLLWWASALWTDVTGALKVLGVLTAPWAYAENYHFLVKSLQMYSPPNWLPVVFLCAILSCLTLITLIFARACYLQCRKSAQWVVWTVYGFVASQGLWMLFFLADQLILNFSLEQNHMVQASFQLLCFGAFVGLNLYAADSAEER